MMRFPVRVFFRLFSLFLASITLLVISSSQVYAQSEPVTESIGSYATPNVEADVPQNQHTLAQSVLIEVLSAVHCILVGIDPINPTQACLDIKPATGKLGYGASPTFEKGQFQPGGIVGLGANMIGMLYTPTTSTSQYVSYLQSNFGLVKSAHAAPANGFEGLLPILELWKAARNIAYFLLILAFIFIGLGVMLRIKIDPRTVMTVQNQIPRVIIAIILITFSYPIAAVMIDVMWAVTYMGINQIAAASPGGVTCDGGQVRTVSSMATQGIYQTPIAYVNGLFSNECGGPLDFGIADLTSKVSVSIGSLIISLINGLFSPPGTPECNLVGFSFRDCMQEAIAIMLGTISDLIIRIIVFIAIIISLFRVWFELIKAYLYTLIYIITAPIWIVFGLAPGKPLGFEKWIRGYFVNLSFFVVIAWLYVGGRVLTDLFQARPQNSFVPPLVGNPGQADFSGLIAFGMLMLAPTVLSILRDKMKVPTIKQGAAIGAGLAAGASVAGAPAGKTWQHLTKRNPTTGLAEGPLSRLGDSFGKKALDRMTKMKLPGAKTALERKEYKENHGSLLGYRPGATERAMGQAGYSNDKSGKRLYDIDRQIGTLQKNRDATGYDWRKKRFQGKIDELTAERQRIVGRTQPSGAGATLGQQGTAGSQTTGPLGASQGTPSTGETGNTPPASHLIVTIDRGDGSQTSMDFTGQQDRTIDVVRSNLANLPPSTEKQALLQDITVEAASADMSRSGPWNAAAGSLLPDQTERIREIINKHYPRPQTLGPQVQAPDPEAPEEPEET